MDESIPSISSGTVGSRFVSQDELEIAKARRDEQWKAAYARLGQEPPPQPVEDVFDGRSLAEKLAANKAAKQEEWEERNKLGNQFRALEEDEVLFLDALAEKQREEERLRKEMDGEEVKNFRQAVAAREIAAKPPPIVTEPTSAPLTAKAKGPVPSVVKRDAKKSLKGVVVKKKAKVVNNPSSAAKTKNTPNNESAHEAPSATDDVSVPPAKRRKVESPAL